MRLVSAFVVLTQRAVAVAAGMVDPLFMPASRTTSAESPQPRRAAGPDRSQGPCLHRREAIAFPVTIGELFEDPTEEIAFPFDYA